MADNVDYQSATPATPAAGTKVSTEEVTTLNAGAVTAQQVQRVLAAVRTGDGTAVDLPGSTADGLLVNLGANNDVTTAPSKGVTAFTDPTCDTTADLLLASNTDRLIAIIQNAGTVRVYLGPSGVTTSSGLVLDPGDSMTDEYSTSAWYGITASGTADLRVCEVS